MAVTIFPLRNSKAAMRALLQSRVKDASHEMFMICFLAGFTQAVLRFLLIPRCVIVCVGEGSDSSRFLRDPKECRFLQTQWFFAPPFLVCEHKELNVDVLNCCDFEFSSFKMCSIEGVNTCGMGLKPNGQTLYQYFLSHT